MTKHLDRNKNLKNFSQNLRKNMTKEERHLWFDFLKNCGYIIYRQFIVGGYILDFYCPQKHLAIELDGSQHYQMQGVENDEKRTNYLKTQNIKVLRYSNRDINEHFEYVCQDIYCYLTDEKS